MSRPRVLIDIDELRVLISTLGIDADNISALVDENGKSVISLYQSIEDLRTYVDEIDAKLGGALVPVKVGALNVGDTFYIVESGIPTQFIVAHKNYLTTGNVIIVRRYALPQRLHHSTGTTASYAGTSIDTYLEDTYSATLSGIMYSPIDITITSAMNTSTEDLGSQRTIRRKIFLPSIGELRGVTMPLTNYSTPIIEGSQLDYFKTNDGISVYNGADVYTSTRTPNNNANQWGISTSGSYSTSSINRMAHPRPLISIASTTSVYVANPSAVNVLAKAELAE